MTAIIIPRRHYTQPQGRVRADGVDNLVCAYAPWLGNLTLIDVNGGYLPFNPSGVSASQAFRGGVGTVGLSNTEASVGPRLSGYPCTFVAMLEIQPPSGNVFAPAMLGTGETAVTSPLSVGVFSDFVQDARPCYRGSGFIIRTANSYHGKTFSIVGLSRGSSRHELYVDGALIGISTTTNQAFQGGAARVAIHSARDYQWAGWSGVNSNVSLLMGAWIGRGVSEAEAISLSANPYQLFRADPIRIYSFPSGPISLTINSITASNITSSGARITLGLTR